MVHMETQSIIRIPHHGIYWAGVTTPRKPEYVPYTHHVLNKSKFLDSNPV